ncbi:protein kinase [Mycobacterium szulgai]|uniref:Protein kinase n=1 Tax=Mycobacterium szulgai TaxID=1787 RepID=A0A1X2DVK4_MYCSZ|nr:serine/threonine-protein kinase [Mycobacterium szulgai]ORW92237.1 protein kinase [Mycobacterium szulgai]
MAGEIASERPTPEPTGVVTELTAAGLADARQIGRGGAGVIYRCHETALGRNVAVKVLPPHFEEEDKERFLREGYAMGGLSGHPNIVNILRVGVTESGRPFIVMPYHAADSLAVRLLRAGPLPWPDALRIGVKLCGALETAHKTGTLHRDIKPANVLINDYGEPELADFGIAHIEGGYQTATGYFSGTLAYTAPEVLTGNPTTVAADVYSLGATIYALIAGSAAHERNTGEDLLAQYLRISSTRVPDMRPEGIPDAVCLAIEHAMSIEPEERPSSAAEFGRELQAAQRSNGLKPDSMAITGAGMDAGLTLSSSADVVQPLSAGPGEQSADSGGGRPAGAQTLPVPGPIPEFADWARSGAAINPSAPTGRKTFTGPVSGPVGAPILPRGWEWISQRAVLRCMPRRAQRHRVASVSAAAVLALLLVVSGVYVSLPKAGNTRASAAGPSNVAPIKWQPIASARVARDAMATTQAEGMIWTYGGIRSDGAVTGQQDGYDTTTDSWKDDDDLPDPVQHAMAVTWQSTPVVLGGWRTTSEKRDATDRVWRMVNSHWAELPHLLQPRAAGAAAVVGDRIIVTGGVDANGALLNTTEVFDGRSWSLGAPIPTPRQMLAAASDGKLLYAVGGTNGNVDVPTVEAYDPVAKTWTTLPALPEARSDLGVAIAGERLVAVGGVSMGQALKSVAEYDLLAKTWSPLPDLSIPRHGAGVASVETCVYAIGGSTAAGDGEVTSSAEVLKLPARKVQAMSAWRALPDAPDARLAPAGTVLEDKIWIMGGMRDGGVLRDVQSYDPRTGVWQSGPPLPIPLQHATAATYRGEVVVIGGASADFQQASNRVFVLRHGSWVELPGLKHARVAAAAAVVGDKLVVVGGMNGKQLVGETEVFDGNSWKDTASLPTPREHLAAVSDGTYVYAIGGRFLSIDRPSVAFERYDPQSGTWTRLLDMPTSDQSFGASFIDGRIVMVGGESATQVLGVTEMYDIADGKWSTLPPLPAPQHDQILVTVGNSLYCIDGANQLGREGAIAAMEAMDFT